MLDTYVRLNLKLNCHVVVPGGSHHFIHKCQAKLDDFLKGPHCTAGAGTDSQQYYGTLQWDEPPHRETQCP